MARLLLALFTSARSLSMLALSMVALSAAADPSEELLHKITAQVVRVQVILQNGAYGVGSGVVVAEDQVVTNCHVIANAQSIGVMVNGESLSVIAIKPDWHHDVCIIKVDGLKAPVATIGSSKNLKYEQAVYATGFPSFQPCASTTSGFVKGMYTMDDSVIVRASSSFMPGDSGGGLFDESGNLVGIIALKSPGRKAYYYNLAVEWVQALLTQPEQPVHSPSQLPFWAESLEKWPHFMRVVQPYVMEDWAALQQVAIQWTEREPESTEALFYLAAAEYGLSNTDKAEALLRRVISVNQDHSQALYYLGLIEEDSGRRMEALNKLALLNILDETAANKLKLAMGIPQESP